MINKMKTAQEAVAGIQDGMTIMVGGFLATGSPEILMDALVEKVSSTLPSSATTVVWMQASLQANSLQRQREVSVNCWNTTW